MRIPCELPVMTLPNATLFPRTLLPLRIFEPRYRQMLADVLDTHRMFCVAMRKPGRTRETPCDVAGVGVVRVAVRHRDGTSHLILQGLVRVGLEQTVRYRPYRIQRALPLQTSSSATVKADALAAKVRELLSERVELGLPFPFQLYASDPASGKPNTAHLAAQDVLGYLDSITNPEHFADLVSSTTLRAPEERQQILETLDVETRLRRLIDFFLAEIREKRDRHGA